MTPLPFPPRYINTPAGPAYDLDVSDSIFRTFMRLRGLAWQSRYQSTPSLRIDDLLPLLGDRDKPMGRSSFYQELSEMIKLGWLRSDPTSPGCIKLYFNEDQVGSPRSRTPVPDRGVHNSGQSLPDSAAVKGITTTAQNQNQMQLEAAAVLNNQEAQARYGALSDVTEPERTKLAYELNKSPQQISADVARWKLKGRTAGVGLLVTMLRQDQPALTDEEERRKYYDNAFSDSIEH